MPSSADGGRAWVALAAVLALGAAIAFTLPASANDALEWRPALAWSQPWRALTAAFVHYSALHLAANVAGTALVAALGWLARVPWPIAAAWLLAWPLTHLGLLVRPDLVGYGGLSGVLHAGVACVAWQLVAHARGARRAIGGLVLAGLAIKVASEAPWAEALRQPPGWDIAIAPIAHASGLVAGLLAARICDAVARHAGGAPARPGGTAGDASNEANADRT